MPKSAPVLVQRGLLLNEHREPDTDQISLLVTFQRAGRKVLLLARQPQRWRPTLNSMDADLGLQQLLHQAFRRAGADLDGTLYLATGLFARRQSRADDLVRTAQRYGVEAAQLTAISADETLLESVVQAGGRGLCVGPSKVTGTSLHPNLQSALLAID